jgi:hypothetical protein
MYILYKNPIQLETLYIVQYLNYNNIDFLPNIIIEKNYPNFVKNLPTIYYKNKFYNGLEEVISLYENISGIDNILQKAIEFKNKHPKYTIKK